MGRREKDYSLPYSLHKHEIMQECVLKKVRGLYPYPSEFLYMT